MDNKRKKNDVPSKTKIRSSSSIHNKTKEKENENVNKMGARLSQKSKLEQIQETVNRLYGRKNIEIKEAHEQIVVRQNLEMQKYFEKQERFKTR